MGAVGVFHNAESSALQFSRSHLMVVNRCEVGSFGRSKFVDDLGKRGFPGFRLAAGVVC